MKIIIKNEFTQIHQTNISLINEFVNQIIEMITNK